MERKINFRLWDEQSNKFRYWGFIDGDFVSPKLDDFGLDYIENQSKQSTGLHDKNGKDIYESDIVRYVDVGDIEHIGLVDFDTDDYMAQFVIVHNDGNIIYNFDGCEVIGNRYENPDLLK